MNNGYVCLCFLKKKKKKTWELLGLKPVTFNMLRQRAIALLLPAPNEALTIESNYDENLT